MKSQKYRRSLGRGRLSRNLYNLSNLSLLSSSFLKTPLKFDCPYWGPVLWDKTYRGPEISSSITHEYKDLFTAHQVIKTFYGDLNSHQISAPLHQLEERLDVLVYRTGKPISLFQARNWIRHGKVQVNGLISRDVSSKVLVGSDIQIQSLSPANYQPAKNPSHLWVKHIDKTTTLAIFKKPLALDQIRYPKGFSFEKYPSGGLGSHFHGWKKTMNMIWRNIVLLYDSGMYLKVINWVSKTQLVLLWKKL